MRFIDFSCVSRSQFVAWTFALLIAFTISLAVAAEPSAQSILDRSQVAMTPPIRYRICTDGVDLLVYQKILSDGSLAMRTEASCASRNYQSHAGR